MLTFVAMLADDLRPLIESQPPFEWNRLGQPLPYEWIERAVQSSGSASVRRRRLPTQQGGAGGRAGVVPAPVNQRDC
jgi:hypothetical protein